MRRYFLALLATTACRAELAGGGGVEIDAASAVDGATRAIDAAPADAPDARPCTGGDQAATAPDGSCLVHVFAPLPYAEAKAACTAMNAHLAILRDAAMDTFAETFVGTRDTYFGLTDLGTEMTFVWDDGSALTFTNWHLGEPNDGSPDYDEDCAIIAGARVDKQWDDRPCAPLAQFPGSGTYSYLCQF